MWQDSTACVIKLEVWTYWNKNEQYDIWGIFAFFVCFAVYLAFLKPRNNKLFKNKVSIQIIY